MSFTMGTVRVRHRSGMRSMFRRPALSWLAGCVASLIAAAGLAVVSNVPAQSTEIFNEVPAAAQTDWHAWWGTAVTFGGSTSMGVNTTAERATKALSVPFPAGSYTLELQGTAAAGVSVTPYFRAHTNWSNDQFPTEAGGASQGQLSAKSWTGSQSWPITMTGPGTHFDLRMVGTAAFTVTRVIIRTASTTTTTTTTPPASWVEVFNEVPAVASSNWHAWWGTAVSFAGSTSMTANTTTERSTNTFPVPAGTYTLELQGTAASGVNVTPYFRAHTNWSSVQLPVEASGRSNGELDPKPWTGSQTWPVTMSGAGTHFDLRLTGTAAFTVTRVILRTNVTVATRPVAPPVTVSPTPTTMRPPASVAGPFWSETPVAKAPGQDGWHPWWGSSNLATSTGIAVTDNAERETFTLSVPAGSYALEFVGTAANAVTVVPHFATMSNWANEKTGNGAANHGQLWPQTLGAGASTSVVWTPVTVTGDNNQLALRVTSSGPFTLTNVRLHTVPQATLLLGPSNAVSAALPGQTITVNVSDWFAGRDVVQVVNAAGGVVASYPAAATIGFPAPIVAGVYTVQMNRDGYVSSLTPFTVTPPAVISITAPNALVAGESVSVSITNATLFDDVQVVDAAGTEVARYPADATMTIVAPPAGTYTARVVRAGSAMSTASFTVTPTPSLSLNSGSGMTEGFPIDVAVNGGELVSGDQIRLDAIGQSDDCSTCPSVPAARSTHVASTPKAGTYQARLLRRGHTIAVKTFTTVALPKVTLVLWGVRYGRVPVSGCRPLFAKEDGTDYAEGWSHAYPVLSSACPVDVSGPLSRYAIYPENSLYLSLTGITPVGTDYVQIGPDNGPHRQLITGGGYSDWFSPWLPELRLVAGLNEVPMTYHRIIGGQDVVVGELLTAWLEPNPSTTAGPCVMTAEQALAMINNLRPENDKLSVLPENNFTTVGSCSNPTFLWVDQNGVYIPGQLNADGTPTAAAAQGSNTPRNPNTPPVTIGIPVPAGGHYLEHGNPTDLKNATDWGCLSNNGTNLTYASPGQGDCLIVEPIHNDEDDTWTLVMVDEETDHGCLAWLGSTAVLADPCGPGNYTFKEKRLPLPGNLISLSPTFNTSLCLTKTLQYDTCNPTSLDQIWQDGPSEWIQKRRCLVALLSGPAGPALAPFVCTWENWWEIEKGVVSVFIDPFLGIAHCSSSIKNLKSCVTTLDALTTPFPTPDQAKLRTAFVRGMVNDCVNNPERCLGQVAGTVLTAGVAAELKGLSLAANGARVAADAAALVAEAELILDEELITVTQVAKPNPTAAESNALNKAIRLGRVRTGAPANHLNGAMAEEVWHAADVAAGEISITEPGKVVAGGIDYVTYDPNSGTIFMNDVKYRGNNSFPSTITTKQNAAWRTELKSAVEGYHGPQKLAVDQAYARGSISGRIRKYGPSGRVL